MSESLDSALCKLCWSPSGHHLACGDLVGGVHIFEAGEVNKPLSTNAPLVLLVPVFSSPFSMRYDIRSVNYASVQSALSAIAL